MTKAEYKKLRRWERIVLRLSEERFLDMMIYGSCSYIEDETGIYNIPPREVFVKDGKAKWRPE